MQNLKTEVTIDVLLSKKDNPEQRIDHASGISQEEGEKLLDNFMKLLYECDGNGFMAMRRFVTTTKNIGNVLFTLAFAFLMDVSMQKRTEEEKEKALAQTRQAIKDGKCPMWDMGTPCSKCAAYEQCQLPVKVKIIGV